MASKKPRNPLMADTLHFHDGIGEKVVVGSRYPSINMRYLALLEQVGDLMTGVCLAWGLVLSLVLLTSGCGPPTPVSPPPTRVGESAEFESLLKQADDDWSFVFADDHRLWLSKLRGTEAKLLLDLREATDSRDAVFVGYGSISPTGEFALATWCHNGASADGRPKARLILINLRDRSIRTMTSSYEGFRVDPHLKTRWLAADTYITPLNRYIPEPGGFTVEEFTYLRQRIDDPSAAAALQVPRTAEPKRWDAATSTLYLMDPGDVRQTMYSLDIGGIKRLTLQESAALHREWRHETSSPGCPVSVETSRVVGASTVEGWGEWYEKNYDREWIILGGERVRCSDDSINGEPVWHSDLNLLTWEEFGIDGPLVTYYMDAKGHYRRWRQGKYWGKIPAALPVPPRNSTWNENDRSEASGNDEG